MSSELIVGHSRTGGTVTIRFRSLATNESGIPLLELRDELETYFDSVARLVFSHCEPYIEIRGASDEALGDDETSDRFALFSAGWLRARGMKVLA